MALFVSFEGPDGGGKSTQARLLAAALRLRGYRVTETREPGGTPLGERLRDVILNPESPPATPLAMTLLLSAARAQLVHDVIKPALHSGGIVIADRFADSTVAYQAFGLGLNLDTVRDLTHIATEGLQPDIVLYVDVLPEVGLGRVATRTEWNRLDAQNREFHERVRQGYLQLARDDPDRWIVIDGNAPAEAVHRTVLRAIDPLLSRVPNAV